VVEPEPVPEEVPEEAAEPSEEVASEEGAAPTGEPAPTGGSPFGVAADGPLEMRQLGQLPVPRENPPPDYPRKARDEGIEGRVVLRVVLSREGKVEPDQIKVVQSVPALDAAAIAAVLKWRFSPGVDPQGRLVRVVVDIPFEFSLR
jgi:protein TonB